MKPVICIEMIYQGISPEEKIERIAQKGFSHVEFWSWKDKNINSIKKVCERTGASVVNFSGQRAGNLVDPGSHSILQAELASALESAEILGTENLMVLCHELGEGGIVVNDFTGMSSREKFKNCVSGLKKLMSVLPAGKKLVLEPLNTVLDHRGYFPSSLDKASAIVDEVADPRLRILCDFYHQGMMGDDLFMLVDKYVSYFGYVHIADFPGRHEPGTSRNDWPALLRHLEKSGYTGYAGFEFSPEGDSDTALDKISELWNSFS